MIDFKVGDILRCTIDHYIDGKFRTFGEKCVLKSIDTFSISIQFINYPYSTFSLTSIQQVTTCFELFSSALEENLNWLNTL